MESITWMHIIERMPPWVIAQLESWKKLTEKEALEKESQLKAAVPGELLFGKASSLPNCWPAN